MNDTLIVGALVVNGLIMTVVIPVGWYLVKAVNNNSRSQGEVSRVIGELKTVLLGLEGQGGVQRQVVDLVERVGTLESLPAAVLGLTEELKRIRDWKHPTMTDWQTTVNLRLAALEQAAEDRRQRRRA